MTTINGVTFNMKTLEPVGTHRNVPNEEIGTDESFITDMGYTGLVLRMTGYEKTLAKYDEVINEFMKSGAHALVHRTGWQFTIYSTQLVPFLDIGIVDNFFPYELVMLTSNPYRESTSETTRSKTITTNNQTWTQDDSTNDIDTDGVVDAVPDIKVTGGVGSQYIDSVTQPVLEPSFETIAGWTYGETDTNSNLSGARSSAYASEGTYSYLIHAFGSIAYNDRAHISRNVDFDTINILSFDLRVRNTATSGGNARWVKVYVGGSQIYAQEYGGTPLHDTGWLTLSLDVSAYVGTQSLKLEFHTAVTCGVELEIYFDNILAQQNAPMTDVQVYNTADTTVKCSVANYILNSAIHTINIDGTGHIDYDDDITTTKYLSTRYDLLNVSYDDGNDKLNIADDGYICWKCDAKYPITGIPTLISRIDKTAGLPTIQIAADSGGSPDTWYDITTAIVDDVETVYDLDSSSLHLKGLTEFYWRFDCVKAAAATCSIKNFELDADFITIDVEHPKIISNGVNTIRCDQDADSGINGIVALIYRDRSWPV